MVGSPPRGSSPARPISAASDPVLTPRRAVLGVLAIAVGSALLMWGLPWATGAAWSQISAALRQLPAGTAVAIVALGIVGVLARGGTLAAAVPSSSPGRAVAAESAATALSTLIPGGSLLAPVAAVRLLRRRGTGPTELWGGVIAAVVIDLVVGANLAAIGALVWLLSSGTATGQARFAAIVVLVVSLLTALLGAGALHRRTLAGVLAGAEDGARALLGGRADAPRGRLGTAGILAERDRAVQAIARRWPLAVGGAVGSRAALLAALAVAAHGTALSASIPVLIASFTAGRALAQVPISPGGAGVTEMGVASVLIVAGAPPAAAAATAVLLLVPTVIVPVICGLAALPLAAARLRT